MNDPAAPLRLAIPVALRSARYRIQAHALTAVHWPAFAGSMLRGAFGHALRRLVCVTGQPECVGCPVLGACPYPQIFETPAPAGARRSYSRVPPGFVLQPPQRGEGCLRPGESIVFHLVLLDRAIVHRDLIRSAIEHALAAGLGRDHGRLQLDGFSVDDQDSEAALPAEFERIAIELLTPVHVKHEGKPLVASRWQPATFLDALVRRIADLCELRLAQPTGWDFPRIRQATAEIAGRCHLRPSASDRWSSRQGQYMRLHGVVGRIELRGHLAPFARLLELGSRVHIGNKTSFGLGRYQLLAPTTCEEQKTSPTPDATPRTKTDFGAEDPENQPRSRGD